ncbi:glycosyltransferase family 4 protein [Aquabacterium sp. OR-4]|uniref:glycosyltransferase family 4 protein n=1 Tax=Aquabacterium sp. OR-4 TaxID=2978127 RepID=UPI0021B3F622|nr:glycosyltransferase family 4 protein [Aquabacterium sp. OR-4]MDT7835866.1 glycosyltransferase family 4 protein [Aquabacterium sp. OR-4]
MKPGFYPGRITVFSTDIPFPPNRGGRADIWRRVQALASLGVEIQLIGFFDDVDGKRPSEHDRRAVQQVVKELHLFPIGSSLGTKLRSFSRLLQLPWHVARRTLAAAEQGRLQQAIAAFGPECLWAEGPWCGDLVLSAASRLGLPIIYRSHNIEHVYMARQSAAARRPRDRLAWQIACLGLQRFERLMIDRAAWVFDISADDLAHWQSQGVRHSSWLPPMAESALAPALLAATEAAPPPVHDVVFLGNLGTPNNVRGVEWLVQQIRPLVLAQRPDTRFVVAGSNPGEHVRALCAAPNVTLQANVPDAVQLYRQARVLVNPVRTGSGTHVKAIEMLMMRAPIVTSLQGTCGLPAEVKQLFRVGETAEAFAAHVLQALAQPQDCWAERAQARQLFGVDGLRQALARMPMPAAVVGNTVPQPVTASH